MILLEDVEAALPSFVEVKEAAVQKKRSEHNSGLATGGIERIL